MELTGRDAAMMRPSASVGKAGSTPNLRDVVFDPRSSSDQVDACVQVDLSAEVITYDSDDEIMGRRRGTLFRSKSRATPVYSREDIREQYCINNKELEVLDKARRRGLFGCISGYQDDSPCNRRSFLSSCYGRKKVPSEESLTSLPKAPPAPKPKPWAIPPGAVGGMGGGGMGGSGMGVAVGVGPGAGPGAGIPEAASVAVEAWQDGVFDGGEAGFDNNFLQRRARTVAAGAGEPKRYTWATEGEVGLSAAPTPAPRGFRTPLDHHPVYYPPQSSLDLDDSWASYRRPTQLAIRTDSLGYSSDVGPDEYETAMMPEGTTPSHYACTSSTATTTVSTAVITRRSVQTQPATPDMGTSHPGAVRRSAQTPEVMTQASAQEDRRQKHVSFDSTSLIRSQTVLSFDENQCNLADARVLTSVGGAPPVNRSQERLIDGRKTPDYLDGKDSSLTPEMAKALMQEKMKKACMRTQATQTEVCLGRKPVPPTYLSLSPRTAHRVRMVSQGAQTNGSEAKHRKLLKSLSEAGMMGRYHVQIWNLDEANASGRTKSTEEFHVVSSTVSQDSGLAGGTESLPAMPSGGGGGGGGSGAASVPASSPPPSLLLSKENLSKRGPPPEKVRKKKSKREHEEVFVDFGPSDCVPGRMRAVTVAGGSGVVSVSSGGMDAKRDKRVLQKTLSDGEILLERRRAVTMASGYVEVDLEGSRSEDVIERCRVQEETYTDWLDRRPASAYFSSNPERTASEEEVAEDEFHENLIYKGFLRKRSLSLEEPLSNVDGGQRSEDGPSASISQYASESELRPTVSTIALPTGRSPLGSTDDAHSDLWSESQVTVLHRGAHEGGSSSMATTGLSDSDNGTHLGSGSDLSSSAGVTPSTKRKMVLQRGASLEAEVLEEADEDVALRERLKYTSATSTSTREVYVVSEPPEMFSDRRSVGPHIQHRKPKLLPKPVLSGDFERASPLGSDRCELARTDSGKTTSDMSETSEDYVTATENSATSSFETATRRSGSSQRNLYREGSSFESGSSVYSLARTETATEDVLLEEVEGENGAEAEDVSARSATPRAEIISVSERPRLSRDSTLTPQSSKTRTSTSEYDESSSSGSYTVDGSSVEIGVRSEESPLHRPRDDDDDAKSESAWTEEERRHMKRNMTLDFPPGTTMFGKGPPRGDGAAPVRRKSSVEVILRDPKAAMAEITGGKTVRRSKSRSRSPVQKKDGTKPIRTPAVEKAAEEPITPGMVRSPAMHEGFRMDEWVIERTPAHTPEKVLEEHTSDESSSQRVEAGNGRERRRRSKGSPGKSPRRRSREGTSAEKKRRSPSTGKEQHKSRRRSASSESRKEASTTPRRSPREESADVLSPPHAGKHLSPGRNNNGIGSPPPRHKPHVSPDTSGHLLGLSYESLRSVSPGSDSVFFSDTLDKSDRSTGGRGGGEGSAGGADVVCSHCGERVSRESEGADHHQDDSEHTSAAADPAVLQEIVKPPAGFADSPELPKAPIPLTTTSPPYVTVTEATTVTTTASAKPKKDDKPGKGSAKQQRREDIAAMATGDSPSQPSTSGSGGGLYKKNERRMRSEERMHTTERKSKKERAENIRAKSEERGREDPLVDPSCRPQARSTGASLESLGGARRSDASTQSSLRSSMHDLFGEDEEESGGVYADSYKAYAWIYIGENEELQVWKKPTSTKDEEEDDEEEEGEGAEGGGEEEEAEHTPVCRTVSGESTGSEKEFRRKYQAITHRMVHRKSSVEMYNRLANNAFEQKAPCCSSLKQMLQDLLKLMMFVWARECRMVRVVADIESDKKVAVRRQSGEFGFRIHGSRPVVVSAIEPGTPAESSGLEVGDIIITINAVNVLDASHSEVVKIAHAGSDLLELEVARTCDVLTPVITDPQQASPLYAGYLWKLGAGGGSTGDKDSKGDKSASKKWFRRWFCLKQDYCLYYYKGEGESQPVGAVMMLNYSISRAPDASRMFAFRLTKPGSSSSPLLLAAESDDSLQRWAAVLAHAADACSQADRWMEVSRRQTRLRPSAIPHPDCFGYLMKLGYRWKTWKRRYCVLKDACLYLYDQADSESALGVAHLHGYRVQSSNVGGKKFTFELTPPDAKFRHFYLYTETETDKKRWLAALEYSIDRWIKVG